MPKSSDLSALHAASPFAGEFHAHRFAAQFEGDLMAVLRSLRRLQNAGLVEFTGRVMIWRRK